MVDPILFLREDDIMSSLLSHATRSKVTLGSLFEQTWKSFFLPMFHTKT